MGIRAYEQHALLTDYDRSTSYSEAFHTLFANIRFNWKSDSTLRHPSSPEQHHVHTLLLTTPSTYGDQAVVAANLAIVAAQSGTSTILVDADLRTPTFQQRFGLEKGPGLSDLLLEESITPEKVATHLKTTFIPGLQLLGAGTKAVHGASLLLSPKLEDIIYGIRQLLVESESRSGIVIFHSPPVLTGADASLIGAVAEQTLLTIAVGRTTRAQAKQAQEQLERAHAKLVGIIMLNP